MEIILKEDVIGLGEEGDIKNVAPGYARNYLFPRNFALPKTKGNLKWLESQQKAIQARKEQKAEDAKGIAEKIDGAAVELSGKVASSDRLYGSIHAHQIAEALAEQGFEIDHRKIDLAHPLKNLGVYDIKVKLYDTVTATIKVTIVSEDGDMPVVEDAVAANEVAADEAVSDEQDATEAVVDAPAAEAAEEAEAAPAEEAPAVEAEKSAE